MQRKPHDPEQGMGFLPRAELLPWMNHKCTTCKLFSFTDPAPTQAGNCCYSWSLFATEKCVTDAQGIGKYEF